jgi:hypothetical protein
MPPKSLFPLPLNEDDAYTQAEALGILDKCIERMNELEKKWSASKIPKEAGLQLHALWPARIENPDVHKALVAAGILSDEDLDLADELLKINLHLPVLLKAFAAPDGENVPATPTYEFTSKFVPKYNTLGGTEAAYIAAESMKSLNKVKAGEYWDGTPLAIRTQAAERPEVAQATSGISALNLDRGRDLPDADDMVDQDDPRRLRGGMKRVVDREFHRGNVDRKKRPANLPGRTCSQHSRPSRGQVRFPQLQLLYRP